MICKMYPRLVADIKELASERKINYLKITKKGSDYYIEYKECESNEDPRMLELVALLDELDIHDKAISNYYLYYDVNINEIIYVINKLEPKIDDSDKVKKSIDLVKNLRATLDKDGRLTDSVNFKLGRKKITLPVGDILNAIEKILVKEENNKNDTES